MTTQEVAPVTRTLTQEMLNAYADASGDHNPIHIDEAFAARRRWAARSPTACWCSRSSPR